MAYKGIDRPLPQEETWFERNFEKAGVALGGIALVASYAFNKAGQPGLDKMPGVDFIFGDKKPMSIVEQIEEMPDNRIPTHSGSRFEVPAIRSDIPSKPQGR